jgi:hypothetical protein
LLLKLGAAILWQSDMLFGIESISKRDADNELFAVFRELYFENGCLSSG